MPSYEHSSLISEEEGCFMRYEWAICLLKSIHLGYLFLVSALLFIYSNLAFASTISGFFILNYKMLWVFVLVGIVENILFSLFGVFGEILKLYLVYKSVISQFNLRDALKVLTASVAQIVISVVVIFIPIVFIAIRGYLLFFPGSSASIPFYHTQFYLFCVVCFKLQIALVIILFFIIVQYAIVVTIVLCCCKGSKFFVFILLDLFFVLSPAFLLLVLYIAYLELFKFDWEYGINHYIASKGMESVDIQEEASNPTGSTSSYYFSLFLLVIYILQLCHNIKSIIHIITSTNKVEVKQVEIVHPMVTPYYQSVPLTI